MTELDQTRVRRYLLGGMSEEEKVAVERAFFVDREAFEEIWGSENDLVDAYLAGELAADDRSAFEEGYLASPVHRERVASARLLRAARAEPRARRRVVQRLAPLLALAAGLILLLASWWLRRPVESPAGLTAQATPPALVTVGSRAPSPKEVLAPPLVRRTIVAAFALSPVLLRSSQQARALRVAPGTDEVALTLEGSRPEGVPADARLAFAVTTVEGEPVVSGRTSHTSTGIGVARIPADRLPAGDYILAGRSPGAGGEEPPVRQYYFRVLPP